LITKPTLFLKPWSSPMQKYTGTSKTLNSINYQEKEIAGCNYIRLFLFVIIIITLAL
jgi:hypothetical protein